MGGLGALDDAVGAIESALGGVSDVLKAAVRAELQQLFTLGLRP